MTRSPSALPKTRNAHIKRFTTSLMAITAVTVIFASKAREFELRAAAAQENVAPLLASSRAPAASTLVGAR